MALDRDQLIRFEQAAAATARNLAGDFPQWAQLIAVAQTALGSIQDGEYSTEITDPELRLQISSRILSSAVSNTSLVPEGDKSRLRLLAAAAYVLQGNHPSANAVIEPILSQDQTALTEVEWTACAIFCPRFAGAIRQHIADPAAQDMLDVYLQFFTTGNSDFIHDAQTRLVAQLTSNLSSFDSVILGLAIEGISVTAELGLIHVVEVNDLPISRSFLEGLVANGVYTLLPPQRDALVEHRLLSTGGNILVSMPTSSGKTLLAELLIASSLQTAGTWACYVTPYVALGSQVVKVLRTRGSDITVTPALGGFIDDTAPTLGGLPSIIVATPERLDSILRNSPELIDSLRSIVFDEAHILQSGSRGARLEGILTRLRIRQNAGSDFRIMLVSAVLDDSSALTDWLGGPSVVQVRSSWRPTVRRVFYWHADGRLSWIAENEGLRTSSQRAGGELARTHLPWPRTNIRASQYIGVQNQQRTPIAENTAYLVRFLLQSEEGAILCICATRSSTRVLARAIADSLEELQTLPLSVGRILDLIDSRYPHLADLARSLRRGVAYHNATLPSLIKQGIEEAVRTKDLQVVAATTTLAEGVDLPFRYTILHEWQMWQSGDETRPINQLLFRNIAGRSGRAGAHTDGDVYVWENPAGNYMYSRSQVIQQYLVEAVVPSRPVSLASPLENSSQEDVTAMYASQFLAAVPENPDEDTLENLFYTNSYSRRRPQSSQRLAAELASARREILSDTEGALGIAASPIRLTPLGVATLTTGLSPQTSRALISSLTTAPTTMSVVELCARFLRDLASAPEQGNIPLRKKLTLKRAIYPVSSEDLEVVLQSWLQGIEPRDIFLTLPYVLRSKKAGLAAWASGAEENEPWSAEFDKFSDFINNTCANFLPWILRACPSYSNVTEEPIPLQESPWGLWADEVEHGVDSIWALEIVKRSTRIRRADAVSAGEGLQALLQVDPLTWFSLSRAERTRIASNVLDGYQDDDSGRELLRTLTG